jgi:hypothetical protein
VYLLWNYELKIELNDVIEIILPSIIVNGKDCFNISFKSLVDLEKNGFLKSSESLNVVNLDFDYLKSRPWSYFGKLFYFFSPNLPFDTRWIRLQ